MQTLPVDEVLTAVRDALAAAPNLVLQAPPGAGKTTRVPPALLDADWLGGRRIIMLEPRRLAARAAARFMARQRNEAVGQTVGYRIRLDTRVTAATRIEVVTEGVLTRMLQADATLEGVGAVIFDEFHERSIHADLGLALTLQSQQILRPDLRIIVMSATLDTAAVAALLGDAPVIRSEGRAYPVATHYLARRTDSRIEDVVTATATRALHAHDGDVLVFLPGAAEIRRSADRLRDASLPTDTAVLPLYGDLPQDEQDRAIAPSPPGRRKVVLATSIAETSLTIEGVRVVIDSGLMRVPRFSPRTGMTRLVTVPVSRASADQRCGRAGRLAPGVCYRLWTEGDDTTLLTHRPPEILEADLAPLALELAAWGITDAAELRWIDPPPAAAFAQARELLHELAALGDEGRITGHGRDLAAIALHPRLAHMLQRADSLGLAALACDIVALLADRDPLRALDGAADPDLRLRLPLLHGTAQPPHNHRIDRAALHRARAEAQHWRSRIGAAPRAPSPDDDEYAGLLLALAYPDRIAQQRRTGSFLLRNGRGARMDAHHPLAREPFIVVADVGGHGRDSRIFLAAPLSAHLLEQHFADQFAESVDVNWDDATQSVRAAEVRRLGAIVLRERPLRAPPRALLTAALLERVRRIGIDALPWSDHATRLRQRLALLHRIEPESWPDVSDAALLERVDDWLAPWLGDARSIADLARVDLAEALLTGMPWEQRSRLDELAPTHITVPSGSRVPIDYSDPVAPVLAVRLQEMFGLAETPVIAGGRVRVTLHLLSPARRPVQVTRDLASFWRTGYFDVRRDLRGRYPKHYWPDDPLAAEATRRVRPRRDD